MNEEKSAMMLVYPNGVIMGFELPKSGAELYANFHQMSQPLVALFVDGECRCNGTLTDGQIAEMTE